MCLPITVCLLFLIFLPVLVSISIGCCGRFLGLQGSSFIALFVLLICFLLVCYLLFFVLNGEIHNFYFFEWVKVGWGINFSFSIDLLNLQMCFIILLITFCVVFYSLEYMGHDPYLPRFISYLLLFMFFMLFLVLSENMVQLFIGWEGVGLVSYLLVNFWFTRLEANRSAIKAILFNRVGDIGYLVAVIFLFFYFKTTDFNSLFLLRFYSISIADGVLEQICFFIFLGAMGKSAQLGLHAWLPDAMEGPTPVSALLHSATMVTAGLFVLLRCSKLFSCCPKSLLLIAIIGGLTSVFSGTIALCQNDLKKIIAYSTCSQLGLMVASFGLLNVNGCFFHLINHAFFKALLFLTAGCIIHALFDEQDLRKMGGLFYYLPLTSVCMLIGFLGLVGFPFLSGYYSKEHILFLSLMGQTSLEMFVFLMLLVSSIITVLYSCRVLFLVFYTRYRGFRQSLILSSDPGVTMSVSIFILSVFTLFFGFFNEDLFVGLSNIVWISLIDYNVGYLFENLYREFVPFNMRFFLCVLFPIGFLFFFDFTIRDSEFHKLELVSIRKTRFYKSQLEVVENYKEFFGFFIEKWWFSSLYRLVVRSYLVSGYHIFILLLDRGLLEKLGPFGFSILLPFIANNLRLIQNGFLTTYFLLFVCGIFVCFCLVYLVYVNFLILIFLFSFFVLLDLSFCKTFNREKIL